MNLILWILVIVLTITLVFGWGFLLWIVAELLSRIFNIVGFVYAIVFNFVTGKWNTGRKKLNEYFYDLGLSKDQHSNVVLRDFFNRIMLKKKSIKFGDPDLTLSWYFAVNKLVKDNCDFPCGLTMFGLFWAKFLNMFERSKGGHLNVAIENKMMKDDAVLKAHGYHTHPDLEKYKSQIIAKFKTDALSM
jgi:hypothetical protein